MESKWILGFRFRIWYSIWHRRCGYIHFEPAEDHTGSKDKGDLQRLNYSHKNTQDVAPGMNWAQGLGSSSKLKEVKTQVTDISLKLYNKRRFGHQYFWKVKMRTSDWLTIRTTCLEVINDLEKKCLGRMIGRKLWFEGFHEKMNELHFWWWSFKLMFILRQCKNIKKTFLVF